MEQYTEYRLLRWWPDGSDKGFWAEIARSRDILTIERELKKDQRLLEDLKIKRGHRVEYRQVQKTDWSPEGMGGIIPDKEEA